MTLEELRTLIEDATWFKHLSESDIPGKYAQIRSLAPWSGQPADETAERLADEMNWLPSSRDQDDPIHGTSLEQRAESLGKKQECSQRTLEIYKAALNSLRKFEGHPALKVGPHDFTEAARGAAAYAIRRAAYEVVVGAPGFWCELIEVYHAGHWPCGILRDGSVVVL